jgi:hypothetical protein
MRVVAGQVVSVRETGGSMNKDRVLRKNEQERTPGRPAALRLAARRLVE